MSETTENAPPNALLPCPFCGCVAAMHSAGLGSVFRDGPAYRVECEGDCHGMTCWWHLEQQAVQAWTRRTDTSETLLKERCERLESALSYALTVERSNTEEWMVGFAWRVNDVLVADGDHRRCAYDGNQLRLRSVREVLSPDISGEIQ